MKSKLILRALAVSLFASGLFSCEDNSSCPDGIHSVDDGNGSSFCVPDNYPLRN